MKELKVNISVNDSNNFTCASKNEFRKHFKDTINTKKIKDSIGSFEEYYIYSTTSKDLSFNQTNKFNYSTDFVLVDRRNRINNKNVYQIDKLYLNYFKGWNNKTLYICSPPITPAMVYSGGYNYYTLNETAGLVTDILKILSKKLNFRMLIYEAPDKQFGAKIGNTTDFTGCVGEILTGKATFGAGAFTFTSQRQEFVDYSYPIMEESNLPVLQRPKMESKRWHIFRPFNWSVWLLSVATIFVISYFCYLFSKYNPLSAYNLNLNFAIVDEIHIKEHLWNAIGGFVLQGQDFYPYTVSARIVLAIWWLFCLIIFSAYTADLTSFLTVNPGDNLLSSLDELAGRTDLKILIPQGTNLDALLIESTNPTYQALNSRKVYIDTIDNCPKKMLEPTSTNLVCITDTSVVVYVVNKYCSVIYTVPETFNTAPLGFITPIDAPFKEKMDQIIQSLVETGIVSRWIEFYWKTNQSNAQNCDSNSDNSADPIDLDGVLGAYILTWIFMLLAFIVFLLELLYKKLKLNIFHC